MLTVAIMGVLAALLVPGVVNTKKMVKRRLDYIQYRDYLRAVAFTFEETLHLEQPLLTELDFTRTDIKYDTVRIMFGEMFYSSMMNGFPYPEMRYLEKLDFTETEFDDRWTEWIMPAPALKYLHLDGTMITDATLDQISGNAKGEYIYGQSHPLKKLKALTIVRCPNITDAGLDRLLAALPKTKIITSQMDLDALREHQLYERPTHENKEGSVNSTLEKMYEQGAPTSGSVP